MFQIFAKPVDCPFFWVNFLCQGSIKASPKWPVTPQPFTLARDWAGLGGEELNGKGNPAVDIC